MQPSQCRVWPKHLPHRLTYPQTSLYFNLEVSARRYPDKPLLIYYDNPLTFARVKQEVDALAGFLQQQCGVKRGDRVLLFMQNSPQFIVAYYAILRADAMVVPINPMNLTEELQHYVSDSDATVALAGQELYAQVQPLLGNGLQHVIVAAYADYVRQPSDLNLPDSVRAERQRIEGAGVTLWADALAKQLTPAAALA